MDDPTRQPDRSRRNVIITPSQAEIASLDKEHKGYSSDQEWRGHPLYQCLKCQYNSIFLEKIEKHVAIGEHPWAFPGGKKEDPSSVKDPKEPTY